MVEVLRDPWNVIALGAFVVGCFLFGLPLMGDWGRRMSARPAWVTALFAFYYGTLIFLAAHCVSGHS
jgi:hypothetical protein